MPLPVNANLDDYFPATLCIPSCAGKHRLKRSRRCGCHPRSQHLQKTCHLGVVYFMPLEGWREDRQHPLSVVRQLLVSHPKMGQLSDPM